MKTIQLRFGSFVEVGAPVVEREGDRTRTVVHAGARAMDARCVGRNESDALDGLANIYESIAGALRNESRLASRVWRVSYRQVPTTHHPLEQIAVVAASREEAEEKLKAKVEQSIIVESVEYLPPPAEPKPPTPSAPSFDDCEDAGLDGTVRDGKPPASWEDVARAALAKLRALSPRTLNAEQLGALADFAAYHGRNWKRALNDAWSTGNYGCADDIGSLQQVRNIFGPSWLVRFSFNKPNTHKELP